MDVLTRERIVEAAGPHVPVARGDVRVTAVECLRDARAAGADYTRADGFALRVRLMVESPPPFRLRNIFVPESFLKRA